MVSVPVLSSKDHVQSPVVPELSAPVEITFVSFADIVVMILNELSIINTDKIRLIVFFIHFTSILIKRTLN